MSAADYLHCSACGQKAAFWNGDEAGALVEALCRECHEAGLSFAVRRPAAEGGMKLSVLWATSEYRGDHSADVLVAVEPVCGETIADLAERLSLRPSDRIEIRVMRRAAPGEAP